MTKDATVQEQPDVVAAELDEMREELKRLDGKARDLLLVGTFLVTAAVAAVSVIRTGIPVAVGLIGVLAIVPWAVAIVELLLVIRPTMVSPDILSSAGLHYSAGESVELWREQRRAALREVRQRKTRRIRRAVDALMIVLGIALSAGATCAIITLAM